MEFYLGTLTREGGEGILHCALENGRLRRVRTITGVTDPNYLILSPDGERLYAVSSDGDEGETRGCVNEYDLAGRAPALLARRNAGGNGPCFLTLSPDGRYLYGANYGTGSLAVFPARGGLGPRIQLIQRTGRGPHPTRQTGPHLHQVTFLPGTRTLCAIDLGTDTLCLYEADAQTGVLRERGGVQLPGGPRHIVYGKNGFAYVAHELSNQVTALQVEDGSFVPLQTLSTLPEGWSGSNTAAAIRLSGDGRRLYVSNRGHGSLAMYAVQPDGRLRFTGHLWAGEYPRDFVLLPDGGFLAADQHAGVYLLSPDGEQLDFLPQKGAVCVCPLGEARDA